MCSFDVAVKLCNVSLPRVWFPDLLGSSIPTAVVTSLSHSSCLACILLVKLNLFLGKLISTIISRAAGRVLVQRNQEWSISYEKTFNEDFSGRNFHVVSHEIQGQIFDFEEKNKAVCNSQLLVAIVRQHKIKQPLQRVQRNLEINQVFVILLIPLILMNLQPLQSLVSLTPLFNLI